MEGDVPVVLMEPTEATQDDLGDRVEGTPIEHEVWATRRDRGGSEQLQSDTQIGTWNTRWEVRQEMIEHIDHTWALRDEDGRIWDIEAVSEVPPLPRRRWWLYTVLRLRNRPGG